MTSVNLKGNLRDNKCEYRLNLGISVFHSLLTTIPITANCHENIICRLSRVSVNNIFSMHLYMYSTGPGFDIRGRGVDIVNGGWGGRKSLKMLTLVV